MKPILIVEDIDLNIDLLMQLLEDDYSLLVARDGAQGVAMVNDHQPDLVLMDISLPVMDGYQATQLIRQSFAGMPIIGLSANAMQEDFNKAKAAGFNDYIPKPGDEDLLIAKINEYLS